DPAAGDEAPEEEGDEGEGAHGPSQPLEEGSVREPEVEVEVPAVLPQELRGVPPEAHRPVERSPDGDRDDEGRHEVQRVREPEDPGAAEAPHEPADCVAKRPAHHPIPPKKWRAFCTQKRFWVPQRTAGEWSGSTRRSLFDGFTSRSQMRSGSTRTHSSRR